MLPQSRDTYMKLPFQTHVDVFRLVVVECTQRDPRLADEVIAERVLIEHHESQRLSKHVFLRDAVVRQRLVPLRVQGLGDGLSAQLERLMGQDKIKKVGVEYLM